MPKLEYPAYFQGGLLGARVTEDIQHREAYLAVPNKLLMSVKKAKQDKILGAIIAAHPEAFAEEENDDWEQFALCIFIFYEMAKGREGFWYPYLRLMPDVEFSASWNEHEIEMFQDDEIRVELHEYEMEVRQEWLMFCKVLRAHPAIFPNKFIDRDLFLNIYGQVCTRCFGHGTETCTMIPMADNLNHNSVEVSEEMVNVRLHLEAVAHPDYFRTGKMVNDFSIIFEAHLSKQEQESQKLAITGRLDREALNKNLE